MVHLIGFDLRGKPRKSVLPLVFFSVAGLNMFLSIPVYAQTLGLPFLVLLSPYLDWLAWIISGCVFACIYLAVMRSEAKWLSYLGLLILTGSALEILPAVNPPYEWLPIVSWVGGVIMSCTILVSTLICIRKREIFSISPVRATRLLLTFLFALVIPLQVWSIATLLPLARPDRAYPRFDVFFGFERLLELLVPMTVVIFVLFVTQWIWFPLVSRVAAARWRHVLRRSSDESEDFPLGRVLLVGFSILISVFVSSYQWLYGRPLGQDARYYSFVLHRMDEVGIEIAFSTERPFFFLILYPIQRILGLETSLLLRLIPLALATILVAATYLFTRFVTGSRKIAALAAVFAAVSPHVTVGVDYFIVANWFGILLMMLFLYGFLRSLELRSVRWFALTVALSGLTLGFHYFTWLLMMVIVAVYFVMRLVENRHVDRGSILFCTGLVLACFAVLIPALAFAYLVGGGSLASLGLVEHMIGTFLSQATPTNFIAFLQNQERIYAYFSKQHYAIPLLYVLALLGSARARHLTADKNRLLRSWMVASSLGILVVQYNEWWRFLYVMPLEMLAALGLAALLGYVEAAEHSGLVGIIGREAAPAVRLLPVFFALGLLLAFSSLPSSLLFLSLAAVFLVELQWPLEGWGGIVFVLVVSLVLEQISRAMYALT